MPVTIDSRYIGALIRLHRELAGLSRADLSRLSGIGKTTIYDIEHGKETIRFRSLLLALKALSIDIRLESRVMDKVEDLYRRSELE